MTRREQRMDSESQTKVDPRKQALLEARFFGTAGREDIEVMLVNKRA